MNNTKIKIKQDFCSNTKLNSTQEARDKDETGRCSHKEISNNTQEATQNFINCPSS